MSEREIFIAALERDSPEAVCRYLDEACGNDLELRHRVELLLHASKEHDSLLEHPVLGDNPNNAIFSDTGDVLSNMYSLAEIIADFLQPSEEPGHLGRLGQFEVLEVIGQGGMGVVLKAEDSTLHRVVAIKVLSPHLAFYATARKRFLREAEAAAAISHPNVVSIYSIDDSQRLPYLVMEYVDGKSLQQRIDDNGILDLLELLVVGHQIADFCSVSFFRMVTYLLQMSCQRTLCHKH